MKQLFSSLKDGSSELTDVPEPMASKGSVLIRSRKTLVSAGTERMLLSFGRGGIVSKVRQQPDKVKMVLEKARTDGIAVTMDAVRSKLDQPLELGYCNVGQVIESRVPGILRGDRVASNGKHAEVVSVPGNLCARIPDEVSDEAASFTVLGAIGLQGIRLANLTLGECVAVTGLGLIGLMCVQMLRAQGCSVLGIDPDAGRRALAESFGATTADPVSAEDLFARAEHFSRGRGIDAVIITASTKSSTPISQAARMSRKRGRIIMVGVTGMELNRADFYEKELTFQVSCSYGPGRYDNAYERDGQDYPIGFVRWTEQRNFEAVLDLMARGALDLDPLISHRFAIEDAVEAMNLLTSDQPSLGIILSFPGPASDQQPATTATAVRTIALSETPPRGAGVGFLGAGNYAGRTLIPAFRAAGAELRTVVSRGGASALHFGRKFGFGNASSDPASLLEDPDISTVVIATRHDSHAGQVLAALRAGKHVFCEKPLCLTLEELEEIEVEARARPTQILSVGFNRRFAPLVAEAKSLLERSPLPKAMVMTVNGGSIPADHWLQQHDVGGGRIVGEACHFIDLLRHLAGAPIVDWQASTMVQPGTETPRDTVTIQLRFADGSIGSVHYFSNGHKSFAKERLEIFCGSRILQIDNFLVLRGWGWENFRKRRVWRQDKGQAAFAGAFVAAAQSRGAAPIPLDELLEVSRVSIEAAQAIWRE